MISGRRRAILNLLLLLPGVLAFVDAGNRIVRNVPSSSSIGKHSFAWLRQKGVSGTVGLPVGGLHFIVDGGNRGH
jgi:hypothetical protein